MANHLDELIQMVAPSRGKAKVVMDEQARPCDSFSFENTLEGLLILERRIFQDGANPTVRLLKIS